MKKHISKFVVALGIFAAGIIGLSRVDNAAAEVISLQVVPSYFQLDLKPGEVYNGTFTVLNDGSGDVNLSTSISPYSAKNDEDGSYKVSFDTESEYSMITGWTAVNNKNVVIKKGESAEVNFTVTVPLDAPGGGQYEFISVTSSSGTGTDAVSIGQNATIGTIIYAKVDGDTRRTGSIITNNVRGFTFSPPISADTTVENTGNVHTNASYILRVYPFFGGESLYNNEDNPAEQTLLPGTKRHYVSSWENSPSIGIYKVQSEVRIFDDISKVEKIVIICPMWVLILIIVFIAAAVFWFVSRAKSRKSAA